MLASSSPACPPPTIPTHHHHRLAEVTNGRAHDAHVRGYQMDSDGAGCLAAVRPVRIKTRQRRSRPDAQQAVCATGRAPPSRSPGATAAACRHSVVTAGTVCPAPVCATPPHARGPARG